MTTKPKHKHRTKAQMTALEASIRAAINTEQSLQAWADSSEISKSHAYHMAQRMGYQQLLVNDQERDVLREMRGVAHRFKKRPKVAA